MATEVEDWDQDFEGGFSAFGHTSVGTAQTSISSRLSVHSESVAGGDEDWNLVIDAKDENKAIQLAQQAGIPLPSNVPTSALLGGTVKRLGQKKSRQRLNDDWENDIEMPDAGGLQLKPRASEPLALTPNEEYDDFDELEGSLGIRFGGTKRDGWHRESSVSAMSPSLGSVTMESEDDDLRGLDLPEGPMDFEARLQKRRAADAELSDLSQPSPALQQPATLNVHKKSKLLSDDNDDFLNDFDLGAVNEVLDSRKRTMNKNIKIKNTKPAIPAPRPATTYNFHDKPVDKPIHTRSHIPRPVSGSKPVQSRLEPVFETGASQLIRERRQPTTTGTQLLRSKRSMPALRSQQPTQASAHKGTGLQPPVTSSTYQNNASASRPMPFHLRRESDPRRGGAQSPPPRSQSRLSNQLAPDTPSRSTRQRPDVAPASLAREAAAKRTVTKPARRRNYGDGNELEIFDDLPTSARLESKFVKQPVVRGTSKPGLRHMPSRNEVKDSNKRISAIPDRMMTPAPPRTPLSPTKGFYDRPSNTPSYLRDTAASRIARESKTTTNTARPRSDGPLMPLSTNWKQQVAARSPHTSPSAQRQKATRPQPQLIKGIGAHVPKTEKGMVYNPQTLRWEGNENTLQHFDLPPPLNTPTPTSHEQRSSYMSHQTHHPHHHHHQRTISSSPPRPALIAPMTGAGVQVNGGMVFDPRQMKWLKFKAKVDSREVSGPLSPSITSAGEGEGDDEEDAFAGIEDLKENNPYLSSAHSPAAAAANVGMASPVSLAAAGAGEIHEEFDLGPKFIEAQMAEEAAWRRRCEGWFAPSVLGTGLGEASRDNYDDGRWRWGIRELVGKEGLWEP